MKKTLKLFLLTILTIFILTTISFAASVSIKLDAEKQDNIVLLYIKLGRVNVDGRGITGFVADIEYDKNIFETITENDITSENGWDDIMYSEKDGSIIALRNDFTKAEGNICVVKLNKKANADISKTEIKLTSVQATDAQKDIDIPDVKIEIRFSGITFGEILVIIIISIIIVMALLFIVRFIIIHNRKRRIRR